MKLNVSQEWCLRMAELEGDAEVGAGRLAVDPVFDEKDVPIQVLAEEDESQIAFGRFVHLMRRQRGLTLEKLADDADVETAELLEIEADPRHKPEPRTVYRLADYFKVPLRGLEQIAGLTKPKDARLAGEAVLFAARSEPVVELSGEEQAALDAFVAVLSSQMSQGRMD